MFTGWQLRKIGIFPYLPWSDLFRILPHLKPEQLVIIGGADGPYRDLYFIENWQNGLKRTARWNHGEKT